MATCIPRVDGLPTDPRVWGITGGLGQVGPSQHSTGRATLKFGRVGPNYLTKAKFLWAGRAISSRTKTGSVQIRPDFFLANNLMPKLDPNSRWTELAHWVGPKLPPFSGDSLLHCN